MEQTTHLTQTVEKLDCALRRLQEVQSALRGHSPLPLINSENIPEVNRYARGENHLVQSGSRRRWSMPTPLTHDALSDVVAVDKFAKKTVDMVKVQKKKQLSAQSNNTSSYCPSQGEQTSLLRSSNRINLPQPIIGMSASHDFGWKAKSSSKENKRTPRQSKPELKDEATDLKGVPRTQMHAEEYARGKSRAEASSMSHTQKMDKRAHSIRIAPEEPDVRSDIIKLRALMHVEQATTNPLGHGDRCEGTESKMQYHNDKVKRSSLSMRTLMRMEDEEKTCTKPSVSKEREDLDPFSSTIAPKSFSVQLEEIKSSRKKSWNFAQQGKLSDNVVVMFPNPTFDERTPPMTTPPEDHQEAICPTIKKQFSLHGITPALPSSNTMRNKVPPPETKGSSQKKEKIVRLSPCTPSTSHVQRPKPEIAASTVCASSTKPESSAIKKQKWRCTLTQPATPTLIRRLPEAHEMIEIKQTSQACVEEEGKHSASDDHADEDQNSLTRSWSFGNPSVHGSSRTSSETRRSSLTPSAGSQAFSFLSKHFQAWKLTSKQDK